LSEAGPGYPQQQRLAMGSPARLHRASLPGAGEQGAGPTGTRSTGRSCITSFRNGANTPIMILFRVWS